MEQINLKCAVLKQICIDNFCFHCLWLFIRKYINHTACPHKIKIWYIKLLTLDIESLIISSITDSSLSGKVLSWLWSNNRIYNYLYAISALMLRVRISIRARCTTLCDKVCQWLVTGRWFSPGPPVSSTNKTDCHDITEILLKVALNTIKQANNLSGNTYPLCIIVWETCHFLYNGVW